MRSTQIRSVFCVLLAAHAVACSGKGVCPQQRSIAGGTACYGEQLSCPADVIVVDCVGGQTVVPTSCACNNGAWSCPQVVAPSCVVSVTPVGQIDASADVSSIPVPDATAVAKTDARATRPKGGGSSCPFVFAWNGSSFQYETDVGGVTLGLPGPVTANRAIGLKDAASFFHKLPHAVHDPNGGLEIRVRETVRENTYIDLLQLVLVDHPEGSEVWSSGEESTNEWGYQNPFRIYTTTSPRTATSAVDHLGNDVTGYLSAVDNHPAPIAVDTIETYTLDFGPIANPGRAKLLIDGWSVYADLSDVDIQPYVEAEWSDGTFHLARLFGAPYGDLKTVVVDLGGFVPPDVRRLRVHLGMENGARWAVDRIRLDDSEPVDVVKTTLDPASAELVHRGRATLERCTLESRAWGFDDENPDDPLQYGYGAFTRYGDVRELLAAVDDRYVIMRHGDQITLKFPGAAPPPAGYRRTAILAIDDYMKSFIKEKNVEPLPFHAMSRYPYSGGEAFPSDQAHVDFIATHNTRLLPPPQ